MRFGRGRQAGPQWIKVSPQELQVLMQFRRRQEPGDGDQLDGDSPADLLD